MHWIKSIKKSETMTAQINFPQHKKKKKKKKRLSSINEVKEIFNSQLNTSGREPRTYDTPVQ